MEKNLYFNYDKDELFKNPKVKLKLYRENSHIFLDIANEMIEEIKKNNQQSKKTVFICPVGPIGQYPFFVENVNSNNISLKNVWFINMDEYLDDDKNFININDRLSFRGFMNKNVYSKVKPELLMSENQRIFPDPKKPDEILTIIKNLGGVDIAFGGIGINGHLAFNEPQPDMNISEFENLSTRVLEISQETRITNCISDLNGALIAMPHYCITIGMKEILLAKKIRIGCFRDWHKAVIRQTCFGNVSSSFPSTLLQNHDDCLIRITDFVANI